MALAGRGFNPRTFGSRARRGNRRATPLAGCCERTDGRANNVSKRVAWPTPSEEEQPKLTAP
jgi:hypothetical protein